MDAESIQSSPYAPVANVLAVIRRLREKGLPDPLTHQELERVGVPEGNAPRTLAALRFLGLIDDEGDRTPASERISNASTAEYPEVLADIVKSAYASVFTILDPAEEDDIALHDAFRHFQPQAQRERMITLFMGLCRECGLVPGGPPQARSRTRRTRSTRAQTITISAADALDDSAPATALSAANTGAPDYRLLSALMQRLPTSGQWTASERDRWMQAMGSAVDLVVETVPGDNSAAS